MKTPYDYVCHDCGYLFTKEYQFAKAPTRARCPGCNKLSNRDYSNQSIAFKGMDFYTNQRMAERSRNSKADCKKGWEVLHQNTQRSLDQAKTSDFYKQPGINWDKLVEDGRAKKLDTNQNEAMNKKAESIAKKALSDGHTYKVKK